MRLNSRNMLLALALGAFTFTATSSWASMMPAQQTPGAQPMQQSQTSNKAQSKVQSISGTIVKSGSQYVLQATNGQEYQLTGASQAKSYVGKSVTVTGSVDSSSNSIAVQSIQPQ